MGQGHALERICAVIGVGMSLGTSQYRSASSNSVKSGAKKVHTPLGSVGQDMIRRFDKVWNKKGQSVQQTEDPGFGAFWLETVSDGRDGKSEGVCAACGKPAGDETLTLDESQNEDLERTNNHTIPPSPWCFYDTRGRFAEEDRMGAYDTSRCFNSLEGDCWKLLTKSEDAMSTLVTEDSDAKLRCERENSIVQSQPATPLLPPKRSDAAHAILTSHMSAAASPLKETIVDVDSPSLSQINKASNSTSGMSLACTERLLFDEPGRLGVSRSQLAYRVQRSLSPRIAQISHVRHRSIAKRVFWGQNRLGPITGSDLKACRGCKKVLYCSVKCQKWHWKTTHKKQCAAQAKVEPSQPEPYYRLPVAVAREHISRAKAAVAEIIVHKGGCFWLWSGFCGIY
ncbi:hypothetical protein OE88DRAFT_1643015 [Heliocybe sulcata]|uniref:MYND-type domain-containing protein n=1 Tax=Heliocybe sulcata TaxID=5364 RepID=A0A5C3NC15_9AGAM|nr:hypothetical protein OE88DRAFT_1643015 [Heliocybe sulcata]